MFQLFKHIGASFLALGYHGAPRPSAALYSAAPRRSSRAAPLRRPRCHPRPISHHLAARGLSRAAFAGTALISRVSGLIMDCSPTSLPPFAIIPKIMRDICAKVFFAPARLARSRVTNVTNVNVVCAVPGVRRTEQNRM